MIRKRPVLPPGEVSRDYRRKRDKKATDFLFECDWDECDTEE